jgi:flagellar hook-associated protein 3 FlgL
MQQNLQQVAHAQTQASTGLRYTTFADDPQAQSSIMQSENALRALEQYRRNIADANARATLEDSVLDQLTTALDRAKQVAIQQSSSTATAETRAGAKAEIDNLIGFVVGLGNTQYAGTYLFGGDNVTVAPISSTPPFYTTLDAPSGNHKTEISSGQSFHPTHNAKELLLDTAVLQALTDLSAALANNDQGQISSTISQIETSHQRVQGLIGEIGARINQLDITASNLEALKINLTIYKSNVSEIDEEEAFTLLIARQTTYQAAMLATTRVMNMTLTDYLR